MSLISPERQYAVNYEISREAPQHGLTGVNTSSNKANATDANKKILSDDAVTLRAQLGLDTSKPKVSLQDFKGAVGKDSAFLEATLRKKLAEYGLKPNTKIDLARDDLGNIQASGNVPQPLLSQINQDLNNNVEFRAAFKRLSLNQPTLDYVANVNKLSSAYGSGNSLFQSLLSNQNDNNSLLDIAGRFDKMRQTYASDPLASMLQTTGNSDYHFTLNA